MPLGFLSLQSPVVLRDNDKGQNINHESQNALLASRNSLDDQTKMPENTTLLEPLRPLRTPGDLYRGNGVLSWRRTLQWVGKLTLHFIVIGLAVKGLYDLLVPWSGQLREESGGQYGNGESITTQELPPCSCGSSLADARALSCEYDTIAAAWLPPHCRDEELIAQFNAAGPGVDGTWTYYADEKGRESISTNEIALLPENETQGFFFTTHRWHILHCSYYWRKLHRMVHGMQGAAKRIEHRFNTDGHIRHCEIMFLKRDGLEDIVTGSGVSLNADIVNVHQD